VSVPTPSGPSHCDGSDVNTYGLQVRGTKVIEWMITAYNENLERELKHNGAKFLCTDLDRAPTLTATAEANAIVVEGNAIYDAGNLLGRGSALSHCGGHVRKSLRPS
jgi:hypothetical protein